MKAPRLLVCLRDEIHSSACYVGRLRMLCRNPRRQMGVLEVPSREEFTIWPFSRVRPILPWIFSAETFFPKILVILWIRIVARAGVHAVIPLKGLKPTLRSKNALRRFCLDTKAGHTHIVSTHVCLSNQRRANTKRAKVIT